jgi:hypothetical protein
MGFWMRRSSVRVKRGFLEGVVLKSDSGRDIDQLCSSSRYLLNPEQSDNFTIVIDEAFITTVREIKATPRHVCINEKMNEGNYSLTIQS